MAAAFVVLQAAAAGRASAQDAATEVLRSVQLHGFGLWSAGKSTANEYLHATPAGDFQEEDFALNLQTVVSPRLRVVAQLFWESDAEQNAAHLDFGFAEWRLTANSALRIGAVPHPFGLYAEIFDVGTLRPFAQPPMAVYGPTGFSAEGFRGLSVRGTRALNAWQLDYDLYGGALVTTEDVAGIDYFLKGPDTTGARESEADELTNNVVGARVTLQAPLGARIGFSGYHGQVVDDPASTQRSVIAAHTEYLGSRFWLRAESAYERESRLLSRYGGYVEPAFRLTPHWQLAAQLGTYRTTLDGIDVSAAPSLLRHDEAAVGLNYWLSPALVLKAGFHDVRGNHLARPDAAQLAAEVRDGTLRHHTQVVTFSSAFHF